MCVWVSCGWLFSETGNIIKYFLLFGGGFANIVAHIGETVAAPMWNSSGGQFSRTGEIIIYFLLFGGGLLITCRLVSFTHLTLPTNREVLFSVGSVSI